MESQQELTLKWLYTSYIQIPRFICAKVLYILEDYWICSKIFSEISWADTHICRHGQPDKQVDETPLYLFD